MFDPIAHAKSQIRDVPDYPSKGVLFRDITPLLSDPRAFHVVLDALATPLVGTGVDAIVGIEARGFIFGAALAARLNVAFVPARKPGKLPCATDRVAYATEYSKAELELHRGALTPGARVVIVDDVLATGGTARAAAELVRIQKGEVVSFAFAIELTFLGGRAALAPTPVDAVLVY